MSAPTIRDQLAALTRASGYGVTQLELIAHTTVPGFTPGHRMADDYIRRVIDGLEGLTVGRMQPDDLAAAVEHYRTEFADAHWRARFWRTQVRLANLHYRPELHDQLLAERPAPAPAPVIASAAAAPTPAAVPIPRAVAVAAPVAVRMAAATPQPAPVPLPVAVVRTLPTAPAAAAAVPATGAGPVPA